MSINWGARPKDWPGEYPYPVTFTGLWNGRKFVVQTFRNCTTCGRAFDETNSCRNHNGGPADPLVFVLQEAESVKLLR